MVNSQSQTKRWNQYETIFPSTNAIHLFIILHSTHVTEVAFPVYFCQISLWLGLLPEHRFDCKSKALLALWNIEYITSTCFRMTKYFPVLLVSHMWHFLIMCINPVAKQSLSFPVWAGTVRTTSPVEENETSLSCSDKSKFLPPSDH